MATRVATTAAATRASERDDRGGYQGRDDRGGYRGGAPADADRPLSFEEAEAQRAEADTWTHYSSHTPVRPRR